MNRKDDDYVRRWSRKIKAIEHNGGVCSQCGNSDIFVLEFHHTNGYEKEFAVSKLFDGRWSKIVKEIDKCELLCKNCHYEKHEEESKNGKDLRLSYLKKELLKIYGKHKCEQCGYCKCNSSLDFHHCKEKTFTITNEVSYKKKITQKILDEILSCKLLCKNCHKRLHTDFERFDKFKEDIYKREIKEQPTTQKEAILALKGKGYPQYKIAIDLGCARSTVHRIWHMES